LKVEQIETFETDWAAPGDWAAMYRAAGLQIVPSYMPGEHPNWKRPKLADWKTLQESVVPDATFQRWYGSQGEYAKRLNMGLVTGRASGNVFVIDLDDYKTPAARAWWIATLDVHNNGIEPETCQQVTGGGGRQLLFRAPADWQVLTNKTNIDVDIRGQGGFAVLPPSLHISGTAYAWKPGCAPWETEIADAPEWLLNALEDLVAKNGQERTPATPSVQTASSGSDFDAFGARVDGRDHYMRDLIWADVVNWYHACPIQPSEAESKARMQEVWAVYERKTKSRIAGVDNVAGLEQEGRGLTLFTEKWRRVMSRWNTEVAQAASKPRPSELPVVADAPKLDPVANDESGPIDVGKLTGEPKEREWIVKDWIPKGVVSILSGDGGMGKTLLAQQLLYAVGVGGGKWLGIDVPAVRGLGVFCEDEEDELHRRHNAIKVDLGYAIGNPFTHTWVWPRVGFDNLLVTFERDNKPTVSPFFTVIMKHVLEKQIGLLILDTAADLFGGNEIVRAQVNYFIKATCGGFIKTAREAGFSLTILLLSHPSQAGRNSGSGESGSTAWNNAVRARLYLTRPEDGLPEQRILTRKKSNYSASGDDVKLDLIWSEGVLKPAADNKISDVAISSIENQIVQFVRQAWEERRPYKAKKGPRFLDAAMVELLGTRVERSVIITALKNIKAEEKIVVHRVGDRRGYRVPSIENGA
jgi:RecA-family ATPase